LIHEGVLFPPEYVKHNVPILYKNEKITLPLLAEEYATLYAKYIDTEYIKNSTFRKNFWKSWKSTLSGTGILDLENCNFSLISDFIAKQKEQKKEESNNKKDEKEQNKENKKYETAIVDGKEQPVGNYRMEPPGIFLGRGCHPKSGSIKRRIYPEDITINIGKNEKIPTALEGHKWHKIIHDKTVEWLASWKDTITGKTKYMWLGAHSDMKNQNDSDKFDRARQLRKKIKNIRKTNEENMNSKDDKIKQTATALYFIDNFALRVGNEKSEDQADTVGVTSLRIEHIKMLDDNAIELDFLGKDSVRYKNKVKVSKNVYDNIIEFMKQKNKDDMLFDKIIPNDLNKYLQQFMKHLTSKVFRTFNASYTFYKELKKASQKMEKYDGDDKINLLLDLYNKANAKVAILCNHQKNVSKSFETQMSKINEKIAELKTKMKSTTANNKTKLKKTI
jgi:DNA topoisomerase-1